MLLVLVATAFKTADDNLAGPAEMARIATTLIVTNLSLMMISRFTLCLQAFVQTEYCAPWRQFTT